MENIRILLIDDNQFVLDALWRRLLPVARFELVAKDGIEQAAAATDLKNPAHVALVGITRHSDAAHKQATKLIRRLAGQGTAVIVLTPYIDETEQQQALAAGARSYLLKTINTEHLIQKIITLASPAN